MKKYLGYIGYAFRHFVLKEKSPFLFTLLINDKCNLDCFYCESKNSGFFDLDFSQAQDLLMSAYDRGHRELVITGGEPMLWVHDGHNIRDVVSLGYRIGFNNVTIVSNGTFPLNVNSCSYIVTVDGTKVMHDSIRNNTYELVMKNVRGASGKVIAAVTLTAENAGHLPEIVKSITAEGVFAGISFNLLTHWPAVVEKHGLKNKLRDNALDKMWELKQQGYPVILSRAAYLALRHRTWKRPVQQIELGTRDRVFSCCRDVDHPEICEQCGYTGCVEIAQALAGKPTAILELLKASKGN